MGRSSIVYEAIGLNKMNADIKGSEKLMAGAAIAMAASVASVGVAVVKIGIPFEQMTLDAGAAMRATEGEFKKMAAAAREAGATTEHTATAAASALKALGKAGLNASEAISSLGTVMDFKTAIGSLQSLEQATTNVVGSTIAMGLEMKDMAHVTDLFITAANTSLTDAALMGQSFEKVAGIANIYGMSVENLTATLGVMANANLKGALAGRQLKNAFANTSRAAAELRIENKGLIPTIRAVAKAGWGADKIMGIYGRIAMPAVVAILAKVSGTEKGSFAYFQEEMSHASDGMGATAEQAEKMRASVGNQFAIIQSQIEDAALSIFEDWKPAMLEGIKSTQDFLTENKRAIREVGDVLLPVFKAIGPVLGAVSAIGVQVFGLLNSVFVEFTDDTMLGLIEIEHAGKMAWAGMKTVFGVVMGEMLKIFAAFTTGAATAFKAIGGFDIAGPLDRASMALKLAATNTGVLTGAFKKANEERKAAIEIHKEKMFQIALEHQGYKDTTAASRKSAEAVLADIRKNGAAYQGYSQKNIDNLSKVAEAELAALDKRLEIAEEFYKKTGILSDELRAKKMADIDAGVTRFRLGTSTEIQIQEWKSKEIAKLDGKRSGKTKARIKRELAAVEKGVKAALDLEFKFLDDLEKQYEKSKAAMEKLDAGQFGEFEKQLKKGRGIYEDFLKEQSGLKELSVETMSGLDEKYGALFSQVSQGQVDSFTESQMALVGARKLTIEDLKKHDAVYSAYLIETDNKSMESRKEFFDASGIFSKQYHADEIQRILRQAEEFEKKGIDSVHVAKFETDEFQKLNIKKLESSESFFDGVRLAAIQSSQDMMTWADAGKSAFNTIQSSLEQGFGDAFKSLMEGPDTSELEAQLEGLQGEYEALGASIVDVNAQIVDTELATQDAIRNSRRATMTEFELFQDDKLKFTETVANAEKAILEENFQLAQSLFVEAQGIAGTLQRVVKDETAVAVAEIAGQFDGLRINFDDLEVSVMDFGKASETALGKSGNIFKSIAAGAKNFEKDIKKINIAAAFGDVNKAKAAAANIIKNYDAIFKAGQSSIQDLMGEWDGYQKKVESVNNEILGINESTEEKIRELRRGTMDEQELFNDRRLEFDQNYAEATRNLEEGNFEFASELFEKSIGLAEKLATDSVGTLEGNTDIAISLMEQASAGATSALTSYQGAIGDSMASVEGAISSTVNALGTVTTTMDGLSVSGVAIVGTLEENTGLAIGLMEEAGIGATTALEMEQAALSANMDKTGAEMAALSDKISSEGNKMGVDWGGVWDGMVETVATSIGLMVAEWGAQKIVGGVMGLVDMFTGAPSAKDGAFDVGGTGPGTALPGGVIPILAHAGESILPAGLTQELKDAVSYDEWKGKAQDYFGISPEGPPSGIGAAADYSASGAALYKAYQAFQAGDNTGAAKELTNAFSSGFETYAAQTGSRVAGGLGQATGGIGSAIGAYQSFQNDDYMTGTMQALQALEQGYAAYGTLSAGASTISTASTASLAAAEASAASGTGAAAASSGAATIGGTLTGAGYGMAAWSLFAMAGDAHMQSSAAQAFAGIGATAGAIIGAPVKGVGAIVGGIAGAFIGGAIGTGVDVYSGGDETFDVSGYNAEANAARTWTSDGFAGRISEISNPENAADNSRNAYIQAMNTSMDMATGVIAAANEILGPEKGKEFQDIFAANLDPVNTVDNNYAVGEGGMGAAIGGKLAGWYWNDTMDALETAALKMGTADMGALAQWASVNTLGNVIDATGVTQQAAFAAHQKGLLEQAQQERNLSGGAATGGIVQKSGGEDGPLNVTVGEGIIPIKGMEWVEEVGSAILKTGVFGGTEARFDQPGMGTPAESGIFSGDARNALMSELLLNDQVTRQGRTNELLREQVSEQKRSNDILNRIANLIESGDEEGARLLKGILSKPDGVTRAMLNPLFTAADITNRGKRGFFSGVGI